MKKKTWKKLFTPIKRNKTPRKWFLNFFVVLLLILWYFWYFNIFILTLKHETMLIKHFFHLYNIVDLMIFFLKILQQSVLSKVVAIFKVPNNNRHEKVITPAPKQAIKKLKVRLHYLLPIIINLWSIVKIITYPFACDKVLITDIQF